jgi:hypothetical protein
MNMIIAEDSQDTENIIIDGKGLVSHYDDKAGLEGLDSTDVLQRYRAYAEEVICPTGRE